MLKRVLIRIMQLILFVLSSTTPPRARFKLFGVPGGFVNLGVKEHVRTACEVGRSVPIQSETWAGLSKDLLYEVENGYCYWNGAMLDRCGFLIKELSIVDRELWKPGLHSLKRDIPYLEESVVNIQSGTGHLYHHNYFHWLYDFLPRLVLIKQNVALARYMLINARNSKQKSSLHSDLTRTMW